MVGDRREFLKVAGGVTVLGLGVGGAALVAAGPPLTGPASAGEGPNVAGPERRFALAVDTRKCSSKRSSSGGCRACIDACHGEHNVPTIAGARHEVKWIWHETLEQVFPDRTNEFTSERQRERPVLVMCNHCDNPPCVKVCPTRATWKRKDGLVMMDQHRCIGCRYCIAGCPYGARSFNWKDPRPHLDKIHPGYPTRTRGVVEKCTLCPERLAKGKEPACVEACGESGAGAIVFGDMNDPESEIRKLVESSLPARRKEQLGTRPQIYYAL